MGIEIVDKDLIDSIESMEACTQMSTCNCSQYCKNTPVQGFIERQFDLYA